MYDVIQVSKSSINQLALYIITTTTSLLALLLLYDTMLLLLLLSQCGGNWVVAIELQKVEKLYFPSLHMCVYCV
jgi:hypothetical protein